MKQVIMRVRPFKIIDGKVIQKICTIPLHSGIEVDDYVYITKVPEPHLEKEADG